KNPNALAQSAPYAAKDTVAPEITITVDAETGEITVNANEPVFIDGEEVTAEDWAKLLEADHAEIIVKDGALILVPEVNYAGEIVVTLPAGQVED
ncbi:hypothetical protein, partial [Acinetobacter indicus]|uniref:hypothetical protein n=1 Tax=Acinetobacter indicus TaxID=756892 RepID=UPI0013154E9E